MMSLLCFLCLDHVGPLLSMSKLSDFIKNILNLCYEDEQRSHGFRSTWGWAINDRIFNFWVNYSFKHPSIGYQMSFMLNAGSIWRVVFSLDLLFYFLGNSNYISMSVIHDGCLRHLCCYLRLALFLFFIVVFACITSAWCCNMRSSPPMYLFVNVCGWLHSINSWT